MVEGKPYFSIKKDIGGHAVDNKGWDIERVAMS